MHVVAETRGQVIIIMFTELVRLCTWNFTVMKCTTTNFSCMLSVLMQFWLFRTFRHVKQSKKLGGRGSESPKFQTSLYIDSMVLVAVLRECPKYRACLKNHASWLSVIDCNEIFLVSESIDHRHHIQYHKWTLKSIYDILMAKGPARCRPATSSCFRILAGRVQNRAAGNLSEPMAQ